MYLNNNLKLNFKYSIYKMSSKLTNCINNLKISNDIPKPLIKWIGGKTQIINTIINKFPKNINNYHEVFLGGGSVLLALLTYKKNNIIHIDNKIYAYDINSSLINFYVQIQKNPILVYDVIISLKTEFNSCICDIVNRTPNDINEAKTSKESYYYWIRSQYNKLTIKNTIEEASMFIFLNKTCFRGMFRESKNGFNVPYGHYKNPDIINIKHLLIIHNLIIDVEFINSEFEESFNNINENDFVYLDPPYVPENINSFVGYSKDGFTSDKHTKLFKLTNKLNNFLMSNSNTELINSYFLKNKYNIEIIKCKRRINSKKPQSTSNEVLIQTL